ncbi:MAG: HNH/ENDO VII family nuclease [Leptospirales bacterium]|nr:HNH/ENDO VII family nuclease [Leptospirales bacterium]
MNRMMRTTLMGRMKLEGNTEAQINAMYGAGSSQARAYQDFIRGPELAPYMVQAIEYDLRRTTERYIANSAGIGAVGFRSDATDMAQAHALRQVTERWGAGAMEVLENFKRNRAEDYASLLHGLDRGESFNSASFLTSAELELYDDVLNPLRSMGRKATLAGFFLNYKDPPNISSEALGRVMVGLIWNHVVSAPVERFVQSRREAARHTVEEYYRREFGASANDMEAIGYWGGAPIGEQQSAHLGQAAYYSALTLASLVGAEQIVAARVAGLASRTFRVAARAGGAIGRLGARTVAFGRELRAGFNFSGAVGDAMTDFYAATRRGGAGFSAADVAGLGRRGPQAAVLAESNALKNLYSRPGNYRAGVRDTVWENAIESSTGRVRDPMTGRFMSETQPWDMGHKPGYEFRKFVESARQRGLTRQQFLDEYNRTSHYRPELPASNRSHYLEDFSDTFFLD